MAVNGVRESQTANQGFSTQCYPWHDPVQACDNNIVSCDNKTVVLNNDSVALQDREWIQGSPAFFETDEVSLISDSSRQPSPDLHLGPREDIVEPEKDQSGTDVILSADEDCDQLIPTRLENPPKAITELAKVTENKSEHCSILKGFMEEKGFEMNLNEHRKSPVYDNGSSEKPLVIPSIRERIAALRSAAHLADLDLTPVRDTPATRGLKSSLSDSSVSSDNCVDKNTNGRHSFARDESLIVEEDKYIEKQENGVGQSGHDTAVQDVLRSLDSAQSTIDNILNQLSVDPGSGTVDITTDKGSFDVKKSIERQVDLERDIVVADEAQKDITLSEEAKRDIFVPIETQKGIIMPAETERDIIVSFDTRKDHIVPVGTQKDIIESSEGQKDSIVPSEVQKCTTLPAETQNDITVLPETHKDIILSSESQRDIILSPEAQRDIFLSSESQKDIILSTVAQMEVVLDEAQKHFILSNQANNKTTVAPEAQEVVCEPIESPRDILPSESQRNIVLAKTKPDIWVTQSPFGLRRRSCSPRLTGDKLVDILPSDKAVSDENGFSTDKTHVGKRPQTYVCEGFTRHNTNGSEIELLSKGASWNGEDKHLADCEVQPKRLVSPDDQLEDMTFTSEVRDQHPGQEFHQTGRETEDKSPYDATVEQKSSMTFEIDFSDVSPKRCLTQKPSLSRAKDSNENGNSCQDQFDGKQSTDLASEVILENQSSTFLVKPDLTLEKMQFYGKSKQEEMNRIQPESVAFEVSFGNQSSKQRLKPKLSSGGRKPVTESVAKYDSKVQVSRLQRHYCPEENIDSSAESKQLDLSKKQTNSVVFEVAFGNQTPKQRLKPKLSSDNRKLSRENVAKCDSESQESRLQQHSAPEETFDCIVESEQPELDKKQMDSVVFEVAFGDQSRKQRLKPKLSTDTKKSNAESVAKFDGEIQESRLQQHSSPEENVDQDPVANQSVSTEKCVEGSALTFNIDFMEHSAKRRLKPTLSSSQKNEQEVDNKQTIICQDSKTVSSSEVSALPERLKGNTVSRLRRGTYGLDDVSQSLQSASDRGIPVVDALDHIVKTIEIVQGSSSSSVRTTNTSRGTYTLDFVADSLQVSSEKGVDVTETLRNLAQMEEKRTGSSNVQSRSDSSETDLTEPSVSLTLVEGQNLILPQNESLVMNRGTYTLNAVSDSLETGHEKGLSHTDVLLDLASKQEIATAGSSGTGDPNTDTCVTMSLYIGNPTTTKLSTTLNGLEQSNPLLVVPSPNTGTRPIGNRGTYTLDEVAQSLQSATDQGIPFVDVLESLACEKPKGFPSDSSSARNRGTYTLDEVSESLETAKYKGIPVVDVLEGLAQADHPQVIANVNKPGNRGTYTLDDVAKTLESAKEKGLPTVLTLDLVSKDPDAVLRDGNAKLRRVEKLKNRKTYALASPLETVSEGKNILLFDGTQRRVLPSSSPPPIPKPPRPSLERRLSAEQKSSTRNQGTEKKGLPVLQKLDFLTSACEVMLESSAKSLEASRVSVSSRNDATADDPTYHSVAKERARRRVLRRLAVSQAAGVQIDPQVKPQCQVETSANDSANRSTYSLEKGAMSLEGAQTAGLPIIDVLDKLSSEQAVEQSKRAATPTVLCKETIVCRNQPSQGFDKDQTIEKGMAAFVAADKQRPASASVTTSLQARPLMQRSYSLDDVAFALETSQNLGVPISRILNEITIEQSMEGSDPEPEQGNHVLLTVPPAIGDKKRGTYSLDKVSESLDEASKDLPIVEALKGIAVDASREIRKSVHLVEELERTTSQLHVPGCESGNRGTQTLDGVGTSLDGAKARGLPVIEALEELIKAVDTVRRQSRQSMEILEDAVDQQRLPLEEETAVKVSTNEDSTDTGVCGGSMSSDSDSCSDYSLSSDRTQVKRGTYSLTDVSQTLDLAQESGSSVQSALRDITGETAPISHERRGTYDLDAVGVSLDTAKGKGLPVIEALDKILQAVEGEKESIVKFGNGSENRVVKSSAPSDKISREPDENLNILNTAGHLHLEKPEVKPRRSKRIPLKKPKVTVHPDSFYIELFPGAETKPSQFHVIGNEVKETTAEKDVVLSPKAEKENIVNDTMFESKKTEGSVSPLRTDLAESDEHEKKVPFCESQKINLDHVEIKQLDDDSASRPQDREKLLGRPRSRATWRPSATVLDKISSLLDTAEDCGLTLTDVLDHVADVSEEKGLFP